MGGSYNLVISKVPFLRQGQSPVVTVRCLPFCHRAEFPEWTPECLLEILGNVYGQNDAPAAWYKVFNDEVLKAGF